MTEQVELEDKYSRFKRQFDIDIEAIEEAALDQGGGNGSGNVTESMYTAKGTILVGDAAGSTDAVIVGPNGQVLTSDSTQPTGLAWRTPLKSVKAFTTTGLLNATFGPGDTSGTWTIAPSQWRVTVPAAVGDILHLDASVISQITADAELDVCSLNGNTPLRYYSSKTSTQGPNGHGGLYMGTQFNHKLSGVKWVVASADIISGNVTLSYMFRSGSGVTWGSASYPNEITLTNEGAP